MKAMQFTSPQPIENTPLRLTDVAIPEPKDDEVLIRVHASGVCHTDLHVIEGELSLKKSPLIPGHQVVGIVERVGKNVSRHHVGDRVGVAWLHWTCGTCEQCVKGAENLCAGAKFTGYDCDGGYAEYIVVSSSFAYPMPGNFSDEAAAPLLCAGIIGYRALRASNVTKGERLGLYGFGASAHIAIQVARYWGCEVFVFSRNEHHRKLAERLGATWTGTSDQLPPHPLQSAISFAPAGEIVPRALATLDKGGTLVLSGIYMSPIPTLNYSLLYHERAIRSVTNYTRQDASTFLKIAAEISVKTEIETFPLSDANRALLLLKQSKIRGAAVLNVRERENIQ